MNTKDYVKEAKRQLDNEVYYKRVERDFTPENEQLINQCVDTLIDDGELEEVAKLLRPAQSRAPIFYMLHKIHKVNNPGRPVVSLVNSHTEKLSVYYVDEFFRPIAEKLPSYIQDTTHFIKRIRALGRLPEKCYRK